MKISRETDEHLWAFCPSHNDTKTANLCINKVDNGKYKKGYGYCFGCGYLTQFSSEAVDQMSKKKSMCRKKVPVDWIALQGRYEKWDLETRKSGILAKKWKVGGLGNYGVGWDGYAHTFPMYNEDCDMLGIQRRFLDERKRVVNGSQLGLFLPVTSNNKVVITEGLSDAVIATHLGFFGIGKPSAGFGEEIVRKYLEGIRYEGDVIICQDNDSAGRRSRVKLQMVLMDCNIRVIVPDTDLRHYYLDNGFNTTKALLEL